MESELNREILCADEICWVVSFIKTSGLNLLWNSLRKFTSEGKKLRIITTTYTGATDYDAITRLASLPNTKIKISYDGTQDRLHAKSYIFLRNSGFHTVYIGSSNLSFYALKDGRNGTSRLLSLNCQRLSMMCGIHLRHIGVTKPLRISFLG